MWLAVLSSMMNPHVLGHESCTNHPFVQGFRTLYAGACHSLSRRLGHQTHFPGITVHVFQ